MSRQKFRILAVDDDRVWLEQIPEILEEEAQVDCYPTIDQALLALEANFYDLVLLDLNFENDVRTGLDVFRRIHALDREIDVIVISGETRPERLVQVFNAGVTRFISKPATTQQIRTQVNEVLTLKELRRRTLDGTNDVQGAANPLIGDSPAMRDLRLQVDRLAKSQIRDFLLQGETGTGKELIARYISATQDRKKRLIPVHCGAIADGLVESELFGHVKGAFTGANADRIGAFEAASGGFVFLDEIGEMPLHQQPKLLRVLQERVVQPVGTLEQRKVSFRTIAATHVDLERAISEKHFREDLYYRIAGAVLHIPALRDRLEDIPELIAVFQRQLPAAENKEFSQGAMVALQSYNWPGNVRQLKAVFENLVFRVQGSVIRERDVISAMPELAKTWAPGLTKVAGSYASALLIGERRRFESALIKANGDRVMAARILGISRATYFRRAKELGLVDRRRIPSGLSPQR